MNISVMKYNYKSGIVIKELRVYFYAKYVGFKK